MSTLPSWGSEAKNRDSRICIKGSEIKCIFFRDFLSVKTDLRIVICSAVFWLAFLYFYFLLSFLFLQTLSPSFYPFTQFMSPYMSENCFVAPGFSLSVVVVVVKNITVSPSLFFFSLHFSCEHTLLSSFFSYLYRRKCIFYLTKNVVSNRHFAECFDTGLSTYTAS